MFGLGWPKLAFEGTTVPIMNMLAKDVLTAPEFAFYFTRDENTKLAELSFGGAYGVLSMPHRIVVRVINDPSPSLHVRSARIQGMFSACLH